MTLVRTKTTETPAFFVNPLTGNDDNLGLMSEPFKTLAKADATANINDTIVHQGKPILYWKKIS